MFFSKEERLCVLGQPTKRHSAICRLSNSRFGKFWRKNYSANKKRTELERRILSQSSRRDALAQICMPSILIKTIQKSLKIRPIILPLLVFFIFQKNNALLDSNKCNAVKIGFYCTDVIYPPNIYQGKRMSRVCFLFNDLYSQVYYDR